MMASVVIIVIVIFLTLVVRLHVLIGHVATQTSCDECAKDQT
jgi:hypothetical protein